MPPAPCSIILIWNGSLRTIPRMSAENRWPSCAASRAIFLTTGMSSCFSARPVPYTISFSVIVRTNTVERSSSARRRLAGPSSDVPSKS
ncbi:MAG TPA: hypothetical protein VFO58_05280 [Vicinamibacterales bacterium]|nr:hypothetical protein [Vicinamibacterales bacterium]